MALAHRYPLLKDFQENRMTDRASKNKLDAFQGRIGYRFNNIALLEEALTHSSATPAGRLHNERLEFLGDRVLGLVIADELLKRQPEAEEGSLARGLNALVRKEACVVVARELDLGAMLLMDASEAHAGGREKKSMLGDACEALIAAIYLDGDFEVARDFVLKEWAPQIADVKDVRPDAKTALQEWAHATLAVTPAYETTDQEGPDHAPMFTVEARAGDLSPEQGVGRSKRDAEQVAAEALLRREGVWS